MAPAKAPARLLSSFTAAAARAFTGGTGWLSVLLVVAGLLAGWGGPPAGAAGAREGLRRGEVQTVEAFWIFPRDQGNPELPLEQTYLPASLGACMWTRFAVGGLQVDLASAASYRVLSRRPLLEESVGAYRLRGYEVRIRLLADEEDGLPQALRLRRARTYRVSFRYPGEAPGAAQQPLQLALLQGIRASGLAEGTGRVEALRYLGRGRFQAAVAVR